MVPTDGTVPHRGLDVCTVQHRRSGGGV